MTLLEIRWLVSIILRQGCRKAGRWILELKGRMSILARKHSYIGELKRVWLRLFVFYAIWNFTGITTISSCSQAPHSPFGNFCRVPLTSLSRSGNFLANQNPLIRTEFTQSFIQYKGVLWGWREGGFIPWIAPSVFHAEFIKNTSETIP